MKQLLLTISLCFCCCQLLGQGYPEDTIGYYHNGIIDYDYKKLKRNKLFEKKLMHLQEKYDSGKTSKEFIRYNDSTFLYTQYYDISPPKKKRRSVNLGKEKEGLVLISHWTTGDTVTTFDAETFEEHWHFDTLLVPIGKWCYFYPHGGYKMQGNYSIDGKEGDWKYYNYRGYVEKTLSYHKNNVVGITNQNIILDKDVKRTEEYLIRDWMISSGKKPLSFNAYKYRGTKEQKKQVNVLYEFKEKDNVLIKRTGKYDDRKEERGTWRLIDFDHFEIELDGEKIIYTIDYIGKYSLHFTLNIPENIYDDKNN